MKESEIGYYATLTVIKKYIYCLHLKFLNKNDNLEGPNGHYSYTRIDQLSQFKEWTNHNLAHNIRFKIDNICRSSQYLIGMQQKIEKDSTLQFKYIAYFGFFHAIFV